MCLNSSTTHLLPLAFGRGDQSCGRVRHMGPTRITTSMGKDVRIALGCDAEEYVAITHSQCRSSGLIDMVRRYTAMFLTPQQQWAGGEAGRTRRYRCRNRLITVARRFSHPTEPLYQPLYKDQAACIQRRLRGKERPVITASGARRLAVAPRALRCTSSDSPYDGAVKYLAPRVFSAPYWGDWRGLLRYNWIFARSPGAQSDRPLVFDLGTALAAGRTEVAKSRLSGAESANLES